jgi:GT2 family glycosyltransferase
MLQNRPSLSIVVPAFNNPGELEECLSALLSNVPQGTDITVVDDASKEDVREQIRSVAAAKGVAVVQLDTNSGPSSARNAGASRAAGDVLLFIDSDVVVGPGAIDRMLQVFAGDSSVAAVFGSYDSHPRATGVVSQYRNLLHHYVHQHGSREASTFWAGFGAVRRTVFESVGGFDEARFARCMEDIELGYRLRRADQRIVLEKAIQGTHLKRWTLGSIIRTDVQCRALPWARLMLEQQVPGDLNLKMSQRTSVALVGLACLLLPLGVFWPPVLVVPAAALLIVIALNWHLYGFFARERGVPFAIAAVPLHLLYFLYSGLAFLYVWFDYSIFRPLRGARR